MNQILKDYNFIAITERMDESLVTLSMLMNVPLADVLYLNAKSSGGFDDGEGKQRGKCVYIVPSKASPYMKELMESDDFHEHIYWDRVLHQAANKSLDLTIDALGREKFEQKLSQFKHAQAVAHKRCIKRTIFPCSFEGGEKQIPDDKNDCLLGDAGCGYKCLDEVATELNLWGPGGPLMFNKIEGFNPSRESQQR